MSIERQVEATRAIAVEQVFWKLMRSAHGVSDLNSLKKRVAVKDILAILRLVDKEVSGWYGRHAAHQVLKEYYKLAGIHVTATGNLRPIKGWLE